jgi:hypothetical protein
MAREDEEQRRRLAEALSGMVQPAAPKVAAPEPIRARNDHPDAPRVRPAVPVLGSQAADPFGAGGDSQYELVNMPAPGLEVFLPKKSKAERRRRQTLLSSLQYRRTLVPIMLTLGVLLPVLCGIWYKLDSHSPFKKIDPKLPPVLMVMGLMFLALGVLNVLQLREMLRDGGARVVKRRRKV